MEDYVDYSSSGQAQATARNSHYSTMTWIQQTQAQNQRTSLIPPPQPVNLPTPVQSLRPLPNPHRANAGAFRVVNTPAPPTADVDFMLHRNVDSEGTVTSDSPQVFSDSSTGNHLRPKKKKSIVRGFVKGIRRLPGSVFGYGAGVGAAAKNNHGYPVTPAVGSTSASATESMTNVLPPYRSNPSSPAVAVGPGRSGLNKLYRPSMIITQPTIPESPPPAVVRLDSRPNSGNPSFRVAPPSGSYDDNPDIYADNQDSVPQHGSGDHHTDRTTVMLYNEPNTLYNDYNRPVLQPVAHQRSASPGLSYVSSEHVAPLRPASYHSMQTAIRIPPPTITVTSDEASETTPRPIYASPTPRRVTSHSVLAGAPPISSSAPHSQIQTPPPTQGVEPADPTRPVPAEVTSPMSVHPEPTNDYRKMSALSSPTPTSHNTLTTATSFYDPSFTSLNAVEKFFKTLYYMPWVSHDRVTVDYLPGEGAHKHRRQKSKPMSSWYHSMFSNSRRSSVALDLLSNGTGTVSSPGSSAHGSLPLLNSQLAQSRQHRHLSDKPKDRHRSHRHHSSTHHHQSRRGDTRKRHRHTATTTDTTTTNANIQQEAATKHLVSPLVPSVYPFHYPPYPYPAFSAFPMQAPEPAAMYSQPSQTGDLPPTAPLRPRRKGPDRNKQPVVYGPPQGYAPYQPIVGVPQVFLIPPISPVQGSNVPSALVPGGIHDGRGHVAHSTVQQQQQPQRQPTPAVHGTSPTLPGAF